MDIFPEVMAALILIMQLSLPVVVVATVVGVLVGLMQALTQIQDQTLPQAVKLAAVAVTIFAMGSLLSQRLLTFTIDVFSRVAAS